MKQSSLLDSLGVLWRSLSGHERSRLGVLFALMVLSVFADLLSIGAIIPFITVLIDPQQLLNITWFQPLLTDFDGSTLDDLILPITALFIVAVVIAALIRLLLLWVRIRLAMAIGLRLRVDLYGRVLHQPYNFHMNHNSSATISMVSSKVDRAVLAGFFQVLVLVNAVLVVGMVFLVLVLIEPLVALSITAVIGALYAVIMTNVRGRVQRNGKILSEQNTLVVKALQEGIGGVRDVIMDSSHDLFVEQYERSVRKTKMSIAENQFLGEFPQSFLQMIGMVALLILAFALRGEASEVSSPLPMLAAFAIGAQRMLPGLQQIYRSTVALNGNKWTLHEVAQWLQLDPGLAQSPLSPPRLDFRESIELNRVSFAFLTTPVAVLDQVQLRIEKGQMVGLVGSTGSGKSTLLDIVMALLKPTQGALLIDGVELSPDNTQRWRANIAHVPQAVFLSDATIAENIAFGIDAQSRDMNKVKLAAEQAQIADFIDSLPLGYQSVVGERGDRLSGGQRQRIGIARALYKNASLLILDEATSALDEETESRVLGALNRLDDNVTVIIVAHRMSTLRNCDAVYAVHAGGISRDAPRKIS